VRFPNLFDLTGGDDVAVAATVKKDSYGATWEVTTGVDLTDATSVDLRIRDEAVTTVDGTVKSPATGGIIQWTEPQSFWDTVGYWKLESVANFSGTVRYGNQILIKVVGDIDG
jgi:hypothetical protein